MKKPILLVPMAGLGQRFRDKGFVIPKPFIVVDDKQIIDYSFESITPEQYEKIIFVVMAEHIRNFEIDKILKSKFGNNIEVVVVDKLTQGSVCSCLAASHLIDNDAPLVIYTLDVYFKPKFSFDSSIQAYSGGFLLTFQANSTNYSYALSDEQGRVIKTAEKEAISGEAIVGIYSFASGALFVKYARQMVEKELKTNNEYYIAPLYNLLIADGLTVGRKQVEKMHVIGTPEELSFFKKNVSPTFGHRPLALCCDHSGFDAKELLKQHAADLGLVFTDFGTYTNKDCDYIDYVRQACGHIVEGFCDFGIGFCRSGQGVNISANKIKGIRSALVFDEYTAQYAVRHNCANFFSIPSKYVDEAKLLSILRTIQSNNFDGGRHSSRVQKIELS